VGAVLVSNHRIVATGYNGAPSGGPSCLAGECPRGLLDSTTVAPGSSYDTGAGACVALHAEQNCLLYADRSRAESATIYVTHEPCDGCRRMIAGSGVTRAVWPGGQWQVRSA
jgi:dCMP deaminase